MPFFLELLKRNALLETIVISKSFTKVSLDSLAHSLKSDDLLELKDYALGPDDIFPLVEITLTDLGIFITFYTDNSKYFTDTERYFDRSSEVQIKDTNNEPSKSQNLGQFTEITPPAFISLHYSPIYSYVISVKFYNQQ